MKQGSSCYFNSFLYMIRILYIVFHLFPYSKLSQGSQTCSRHWSHFLIAHVIQNR